MLSVIFEFLTFLYSCMLAWERSNSLRNGHIQKNTGVQFSFWHYSYCPFRDIFLLISKILYTHNFLQTYIHAHICMHICMCVENCLNDYAFHLHEIGFFRSEWKRFVSFNIKSLIFVCSAGIFLARIKEKSYRILFLMQLFYDVDNTNVYIWVTFFLEDKNLLFGVLFCTKL